jgi:hypothetical protein
MLWSQPFMINDREAILRAMQIALDEVHTGEIGGASVIVGFVKRDPKAASTSSSRIPGMVCRKEEYGLPKRGYILRNAKSSTRTEPLVMYRTTVATLLSSLQFCCAAASVLN